MKNIKLVNWELVERLCLRSFTGSGLSEEEMKVLQDAYKSNPQEYKLRTEEIRHQERARIKMM